MGTLAQMIYRKDLMDLPTSGLFNLPLMWSFERRLTIQHFSHLVEQEVETGNVPHLSELLKNVRVFIFHYNESTHITSLPVKTRLATVAAPLCWSLFIRFFFSTLTSDTSDTSLGC